MTLRFAELFAGAGGLSMGLERAGWEAVWHAEIADAPRAILTHRWPETPLYGDVTTLDGKALTVTHGAIDLLTGGSPCQDLSVAGKRAGLSGARSGLFYEQMRLWEETGADLCLWENVDGARSSNTGKDFGEVLRAFVGAAVAVPSDGWRSAGVAAGPGGVAAWRVLDAQFFGVPQRRRRVFVLGTRTGRIDPAEVLSLAEGVRGDSASRREAREGTPADARRGVASESGQGWWSDEGSVAPLRADPGGMPSHIAFGAQNSAAQGASVSAKCTPTLDKSKTPAVLSFDWQKGNDVGNPRPSTMNVLEDVTNTLGSTRVPAVVPLQEVGKRTGTSTTDPRAGIGIGSEGDPMYTLQAGAQHGVVCLTGDVTHALTHEGHDASEDGTGRGTPIVVTDATRFQCTDCGHRFGVNDEPDEEGLLAHFGRLTNSVVCPKCMSDGLHTDFYAELAVFNETGHEKWTEEMVAGSLNAHEAREAHTIVADHEIASTLNGTQRQQVDGAMTAQHGIPRRLTPRECERLMSWPDDHTLVPDAKGKPLSDAARYKAAGNGVASVHSHWIGWRLRLALEGE